MGFILDKTSGKGTATIKITPDSKNTQKVAVNKSLQIQVNGVTKAVVQLIQSAKAPVLAAFCSSDNATAIAATGGQIKITYWATEDGEKVTSPTLKVSVSTNVSYDHLTLVSSGANTDGTFYKTYQISANTSSDKKYFTFNATYETASSDSITFTQAASEIVAN